MSESLSDRIERIASERSSVAQDASGLSPDERDRWEDGWIEGHREVTADNEHLRAALQFFADGGYYEQGGEPRKVPFPLQVKAREALAEKPHE